MPLEENQNSYEMRYLVLPTMKRRQHLPPPRRFSIVTPDQRAMKRYFDSRRKWIDFCKARDRMYSDPRTMFLSTAIGNLGAAIGKAGLEKDFQRVCKFAGFENEQVCFSMFRHRFITWEVLIHLKEWERQKGRVTIDQDYRAVLERVRVKTGHASVESLWHYIDLARDMEKAFENMERVAYRMHAIENINSEVREFRRALLVKRGRSGLSREELELLGFVCHGLDTVVQNAKSSGIG
jgi:hypothetical protein